MFFATQTPSVRSYLVLAILTALTTFPAAGKLPIAPTCSGTPHLDAGATGVGTTNAESFESCFEIQSDAGILLLDLAAPGSRTRMTVEVCPGSKDVLIETVGAKPGQRILRLDRPSQLLVCTLPLEPGPRHQWTLRTSWTLDSKNQQIEIEPDNNVDGENQQIEIEPDNHVDGEYVDGENQQIEIEPDNNVDGEYVDGKNQQIEIEPDVFATLCHGHTRDDYADLDRCATTQLQAGRTDGRLDHPGDRDILVLEFEALATLVLEVTGRGSIEAELVDSQGNRLAFLVDGGSKTGALTTLAPGTYFLRISGAPQDWQVRAEIL